MILPLVLGLWSCSIFTLFFKVFLMTVFMRLVLLIKTKWVGLENYIQMFHDSTMWHALFNTMRYVLVIVPSVIILSLLLAVFLNMKIKGKIFFQSSVFHTCDYNECCSCYDLEMDV